tara:strand:+ start:647 stop:1330 length:684 start_codon:yes stop_codon:yes gene_type:complete
MALVKNTMLISFFAQIITLFIGVTAQFLELSKKHRILKQALALENIVQFVEGCFYLWFILFYIKNVDKTDIAKYRYYDWFITTPTMILSSIVYFQYNNTKNTYKEGFTLLEFIKTDKENIIEISLYNFAMLIFGYLQEIGLINLLLSTGFGFLFFGLMFYKIYEYYAKKSSSNLFIFFIMLSIWSIYGIAALFKFNIKNAFYNILDIFSKNFYGLFLAYIVYSLSSK